MKIKVTVPTHKKGLLNMGKVLLMCVLIMSRDNMCNIYLTKITSIKPSKSCLEQIQSTADFKPY